MDLEVFQKISDLQKSGTPIMEIASVYGDYDLMAKVQFTTTRELEDFVFKKLRQIKGISETKTLFAAKFVEFG